MSAPQAGRKRYRHLAVVLLAWLLAAWSTTIPAREVYKAASSDAPVVARITVKNASQEERLLARGLDLLEMRAGNDFFVLTTRAQLAQLRDEGWLTVVDQEHTGLFSRQSTNTFYGGYRTVDEMRAALEAAEAKFPALAEVFVYGRSWQGRDLFGITLTNKAISGPKPTFFLMAGIHARELTTPELALRLVDYLLSRYGRDGDATWLLDDHNVVVVPSANPDGHLKVTEGNPYPYTQRKNRNTSLGPCADPPTTASQYGVDLNRNSSFQWGGASTSTEPCAPVFKGPSAASEPETQALQQLIRSLFPDQRGPGDSDAAPPEATGIMITLHSFSDLVLYPWSWANLPAPNGPELALIGGRFAAYNSYRHGRPGEVLYNASGTTDDWAYGELGIASFTFEVGPGGSDPCAGFMPPYSCIDGEAGSSRAFWPENRPALLYAARIARAPYQLVHGPSPETLVLGRGADNQAVLSVVLDEQVNGGQPVSAAEYFIDVPPWRGGTGIAMAAADGRFDSPVETATAMLDVADGRYLVFVRGRDADGNWGPTRAIWVTLPSGVHLPSIAR